MVGMVVVVSESLHLGTIQAGQGQGFAAIAQPSGVRARNRVPGTKSGFKSGLVLDDENA